MDEEASDLLSVLFLMSTVHRLLPSDLPLPSTDEPLPSQYTSRKAHPTGSHKPSVLQYQAHIFPYSLLLRGLLYLSETGSIYPLHRDHLSSPALSLSCLPSSS